MSSASVVLDASAAIALINDEPGAGQVGKVLADAVMCSVNLAEVSSKLADFEFTDKEIESALSILPPPTPLDATMIALMPRLRRVSRDHGLSLGDRCCMACGMIEGLPVFTADREWAKVRTKGLRVKILER